MREGVAELLARVNARVGALLEDVKRALRGEGKFDSEEIAKLREALDEMEPVLLEHTEIRRLRPDLEGQLDLYKAQLGDLQKTLEQVRIMLLARQASLEAGRAQIAAVSQWVEAYRVTESNP